MDPHRVLLNVVKAFLLVILYFTVLKYILLFVFVRPVRPEAAPT